MVFEASQTNIRCSSKTLHRSHLGAKIDCSPSDFQPMKQFIQTDYPRVARFPTRWSRGTKTLGMRLAGVALGIFILGLGTHICGQIGVSSILGVSQNQDLVLQTNQVNNRIDNDNVSPNPVYQLCVCNMPTVNCKQRMAAAH